jgi:hypothetical protein
MLGSPIRSRKAQTATVGALLTVALSVATCSSSPSDPPVAGSASTVTFAPVGNSLASSLHDVTAIMEKRAQALGVSS